MAELITMALFCGALIVCIIAGISIIPALLAGVVIFLAHGRLTGHTFTAMISKGFATMRAASIVVVTFVLIGLLTTLWRAAGTVSFIVTNTAGLVHPHVGVYFIHQTPPTNRAVMISRVAVPVTHKHQTTPANSWAEGCSGNTHKREVR